MNYRPKLADHLASVRANIKVFGLWTTLREIVSYLAEPNVRDDGFDQVHHVDTAASVYAHEAGLRGKSAISASHYHPAPSRLIAHALRDLPIRREDYVFVDFGSGKGRALLVAASSGFKRVVGVEASPALHDVAVNNIATFQAANPGGPPIEALCMDCLEYEFPDDNVVLYMYHPFDASVMRDALQRVVDAFSRSSHEIYIVYLSPFHDQVFNTVGGFEEVRCCQVMKFDQSWAVYRYQR